MSSLVSCHLVNCIMDCIKTSGLCSLSEICLTSSSAVLSLNSHLEVLLCAVCDNLTEELCELSSVLSLFVSCLLPVKTDLRITFSVGNSCHSEVHTNLRALTVEVCS